MSDIVIKAHNLSKKYRLYDDPMSRLKEALHPLRKKYHHDFHALNKINFEVKRGETVGIIGKNGAGKSTLLQILTGVLTPTSGTYSVQGKISSLLELGSGFNPEISGLENVYFNGTILGYSQKEINEKLDNILAFADIGDFIHQPVKTYSSGMYVRLAFAVAINIDPDILIVDEALAVGDVFFQAKCMTRMRQMMDRGVTMLFVSHDPSSIKSLCQRALLLEKGKVSMFDNSDKVVEKYFRSKVELNQNVLKENRTNEVNQEIKRHAFSYNKDFEKKANFQRIQNGKAAFANIQLLDKDGEEIKSVHFDQEITLRMAIEAYEDIHLLGYGYHIRDKNGVDIVYSDSVIEDHNIENIKKGDRFIIDWSFKTPFVEGDYNIACVLSIPINIQISEVDFCDFIPIAAQFRMELRKMGKLHGAIHLENKLKIIKL